MKPKRFASVLVLLIVTFNITVSIKTISDGYKTMRAQRFLKDKVKTNAFN